MRIIQSSSELIRVLPNPETKHQILPNSSEFLSQITFLSPCGHGIDGALSFKANQLKHQCLNEPFISFFVTTKTKDLAFLANHTSSELQMLFGHPSSRCLNTKFFLIQSSY
jgi:hypothetical protein